MEQGHDRQVAFFGPGLIAASDLGQLRNRIPSFVAEMGK